MTKLWHPHIKDMTIEKDESRVAAYVAAGWLQGPPRREFLETDSTESIEEVLAERAEKPARKSTKATQSTDVDETSPATDEDK